MVIEVVVVRVGLKVMVKVGMGNYGGRVVILVVVEVVMKVVVMMKS